MAIAALRILGPWSFFPWLVGWEFYTARGKSGRPGAAIFPTTEHSAPEVEYLKEVCDCPYP